MAEQLTCNQQVVGSIPIASSNKIKETLKLVLLKKTKYGGVPEWPKGADCKSVTLVSMVRIHLPPPI